MFSGNNKTTWRFGFLTPADHIANPLSIDPDGGSFPRNPKPRRALPPPPPSAVLQAAAAASRPASVSSLATALAVLVAFTASAGSAAGGETQGQDGGVPPGVTSHGAAAVVDEAFLCLVSLSETAPESSAQAECVKVALVSLKECVQVCGRGGARSGGENDRSQKMHFFGWCVGCFGHPTAAAAVPVPAAFITLHRLCHCSGSRLCSPFPISPSPQAARLVCLERRVPALLSMLEGVPSRLKLLLTRYGSDEMACPCRRYQSIPWGSRVVVVVAVPDDDAVMMMFASWLCA